MPRKGTIEAIFLIRQIQEKSLAKSKTLYLIFVDLEKAFDVFSGRSGQGIDE